MTSGQNKGKNEEKEPKKPKKEKIYTHHIKVKVMKNGVEGKVLILGHGKTPQEARQKAEQAAQAQNISLTGAEHEGKVKIGSLGR